MKPEGKKLSVFFLCVIVIAGALAFHLWTSPVIPPRGDTAGPSQEIDRAAHKEAGPGFPEEEKEEDAEDVHTAPGEPGGELTENSDISGEEGLPDEIEAARQNPSTGAYTDTSEDHPDNPGVPEPGHSISPPPEEGVNPPLQPAEPEVSPHDTYLNDYVQAIIPTYKGHYPYLLNNDYANYNGVTENLYYRSRLLARAHPSGNRASHCVGLTFEVFFRAMQERNRKLGLDPDDFNGMNFDELFDFLLIWYVASGSKETNNIELAVEKYGIGMGVSRLEDARPGDFMDINRSNGSGHTVVFQNWIRSSNGCIEGVRYWSTQGSTNGIGFNTEYFDVSGRGNVYFNRVYIARVLPVHRYKSFK